MNSELIRVLKCSRGFSSRLILLGVYLYILLSPHISRASRGSLAAPDPAPGERTGSRLFSLFRIDRLARMRVLYRMSDGSRVHCRLMDSGGVFSVHVDRDYDMPGIHWADVHTVVDLGAHVGAFTIWAARRAPGARILTVEPNPETFSLLLENLRENGLLDRVKAVNAAVAPVQGTVALELLEHSLGTRVARDGVGEVNVPAETLEGLVFRSGMGTVDILKMDCEGMEYQVFESIRPDLLDRIEALACEYHPEPGRDVEAIDRKLQSAGFRVSRPDQPLSVLWATR